MWKSFLLLSRKNETFTQRSQVLNTSSMGALSRPINSIRISYGAINNIHKKTKRKEELPKNKSNTKSNDKINKGAKTRACLPTNFLKAWIGYIADH